MFEFIQNQHLEQSVILASEIQNAFTSAKRVNRGVRQAGFMVLWLTSMPGAYVELGFITNKEEEQYLRSADGQNQLARSIYVAFKSYKEKYGSKQQINASNTNSSASTISSLTNNTGQIVYKVQILTTDKPLPANSPSLKGYKADWYQDGNLYKYTYGESTDFQTIQTIQKQVSKDFKDAFIIRMRDGKRLN